MVELDYEQLLKMADSKYTVVIAAAKRARQLMSGEKVLVRAKGKKPVTIALEELASGRLRYERLRSGLK